MGMTRTKGMLLTIALLVGVATPAIARANEESKSEGDADETPVVVLGATAGPSGFMRFDYTSSWEGVGGKTPIAAAVNVFGLFSLGRHVSLGPSLWIFSTAEDVAGGAAAFSPSVRLEAGGDVARVIELHAFGEMGGLFYLGHSLKGFEGGGGVGMLGRITRAFAIRFDTKLSGYSVSNGFATVSGPKLSFLLGPQIGF